MARQGHLRTPRLALVPVTEADPDAIAAILYDFEVTRWLARVPHPYSRADAVAFQERAGNAGARSWIALDADGVAGGIGTDDHLGYWVARRAWGRGYATEMARVVVDAWFADPAAPRLISGHFEGNVASRRILEKLGFRLKGTSMLYSLSLGREVGHYDMALTHEDWDAARLRIAAN